LNPAARLALAAALAAPLLASADSACWREPLLIGQRVAGLANATQLWSRTPQASPDAPPMAGSIPRFDARGRPAGTLACGQIRTRVNEKEAACSADADQDDGTLWVAVIDGPVGGRVRVPLKSGGSAWIAFRPDHALPEGPVADATVAASSLARHGAPGRLVASTDPRATPPLWPRPEVRGAALAWTPAQEAAARAFVTRAAPDAPVPGGAWLTPAALGKEARWEITSQVVQIRRGPRGEWWRVQQWLQPVEAIDPAPVADGRTVLALDYSVRSATLREGWVRHRDARGIVRAVITDGAACD